MCISLLSHRLSKQLSTCFSSTPRFTAKFEYAFRRKREVFEPITQRALWNIQFLRNHSVTHLLFDSHPNGFFSVVCSHNCTYVYILQYTLCVDTIVRSYTQMPS